MYGYGNNNTQWGLKSEGTHQSGCNEAHATFLQLPHTFPFLAGLTKAVIGSSLVWGPPAVLLVSVLKVPT